MNGKARRWIPTVLMALLLVVGTALPALAETPDQTAPAPSIASVAAKAKPSVVGILNTMKANRSTERGRAAGTGFVYKDGVIVTNAHVVENAAELKILYADKTVETVYPTTVFADETSDIAVIRVTKHGLTPLSFTNSDNLTVGQQVVAVGNPLGFRLGNSVSAGILSGVGRAMGSAYPFLQVDAPINPGNSGGPLFNLKGEVIGINSSKMSEVGVEGLGFAIPSNTAAEIAETLLKNGKVERATLGISFDEGWEAYFGVPDAEGVAIGNVILDGPAGLTALLQGDKLIKLDEKAISTTDDVYGFLAAHKPGQEVTITVKRGGQLLGVKVKLASQDDLKRLAEGDQVTDEGGILFDMTAGQVQEAAEFGRSLSRGATRLNNDYFASSGSNYAELYTEFLYVARRISSAYEFGFTPGVAIQQQAAKEIRNRVEVRMELNGEKPNFLDGATFWLEQGGTKYQAVGSNGTYYTTSPDGFVVIADTSLQFPTAGLSRTQEITVTAKLADGKAISFQFALKDLR
jgi:S1-C subfamily serine protease